MATRSHGSRRVAQQSLIAVGVCVFAACNARVEVLGAVPEPDAGSMPADPARDGSVDGGQAVDGMLDALVPVEPDAAAEEAGTEVALPEPLLDYRFDEGAGVRVLDSSSGAPLTHLTIENPEAVTWTATGLQIDQPTRLSSEGAPSVLASDCQASNELTVEAWVVPAETVVANTRRILSMSSNQGRRNFLLGQGALSAEDPAAAWVFRVRTTATDANGLPMLSTGDGVVELRLTHVVGVRRADGTTLLFVDGVERARGMRGGDLSNWEDSLRITVGDEFQTDNDRRTWRGELRGISVYCEALSERQVGARFEAGP